MIEGRKSQFYSVPLEVRRGIGAEFVDESASIHVGSGGKSVSPFTYGEVRKRLHEKDISPETYAEGQDVGFREKNKHTGVQEGFGKFVLDGAGTNYIKNGVLTVDMRYAYICIHLEARGSKGVAYYVYENAAAGTGLEGGGQDRPGKPDPSVETISGSPKGRDIVLSGDFERGLVAPWGTGQYAAGKSAWWNSGKCNSVATADQSDAGGLALHIINHSPRAPHTYGTTQQPLRLEAGQRYSITAWARANNLRSDGGASIAVDDAWKIRPIQLPRGTYGWTKFAGTFVAGNSGGQLRIISEDSGEIWFDGIQVVKE
jgi:hypothetical protein